jgi:hypothetical protein
VIRSALLIFAIGLVAGIGTPDLGSAREPGSEHPVGDSQREDSEQPEGREEWRKELLAANQAVAIAHQRSAAALEAYRNMRQRRRPRGDAKQAIIDELELSSEAIATAERELEKLEKAARRAGAPPSWLKFDPAEIEAGLPVPASQ